MVSVYSTSFCSKLLSNNAMFGRDGICIVSYSIGSPTIIVIRKIDDNL